MCFPHGFFAPGVCESALVEMQGVRHSADYDPYAEFEEPLTKAFVESRISRAEQIIRDFNAEHKKDRKAFSIYVLLKRRDFNLASRQIR